MGVLKHRPQAVQPILRSLKPDMSFISPIRPHAFALGDTNSAGSELFDLALELADEQGAQHSVERHKVRHTRLPIS
jgi:hypothetical protein